MVPAFMPHVRAAWAPQQRTEGCEAKAYDIGAA